MHPHRLLKILGNKHGGYAQITLTEPRAIHAQFLLLLAGTLGEITLRESTREFLHEQIESNFWGRDSLSVTFELTPRFRPHLFTLGLHYCVDAAVWLKITEEPDDYLLLQAADMDGYYRVYACDVEWDGERRVIYPIEPNKLPPMMSTYANQIYG